MCYLEYSWIIFDSRLQALIVQGLLPKRDQGFKRTVDHRCVSSELSIVQNSISQINVLVIDFRMK